MNLLRMRIHDVRHVVYVLFGQECAQRENVLWVVTTECRHSARE